MRFVLFLAPMTLLLSDLYAIPAQPDYLIRNLRGTVAIDLHDVRVERGEQRVHFWHSYRIDYLYPVVCRVKCELRLREASDGPLVLERSINFTIGNDSPWTFRTTDRRIESLQCTKYCYNTADGEDPPWRNVTAELNVENIQNAFGGSALDRVPRMTIHLGTRNLGRETPLIDNRYF